MGGVEGSRGLTSEIAGYATGSFDSVTLRSG